jgi:small-conductance mechanosensitive channel
MDWINESYLITNGLHTLIFLTILILLRIFLTRAVRKMNKPWTAEVRLRMIGYVRSFFFISLLIGMLYIWGEQVHNFAVSIFAIAFALVFSVKELFMCINGSVMRFRGNVYNLGDRIDINGIRGDVIDMNLLSTTLLEIGPGEKSHHHTGRVVIFPNSMVINHFVVNESYLEHFFYHTLHIPMRVDDDWKEASKLLTTIAKEECAPYLDMARRRVQEMARHKSIDLPSVEPRVILQLPKPGEIDLILRFPGPAHLKGRLGQTILTRFLEKFNLKAHA